MVGEESEFDSVTATMTWQQQHQVSPSCAEDNRREEHRARDCDLFCVVVLFVLLQLLQWLWQFLSVVR